MLFVLSSPGERVSIASASSSRDSPECRNTGPISPLGRPSWREAFRGDRSRVLRIDGSVRTRDEILRTAREEAEKLSPDGEWWLVLVGHGNYDGRRYKFNIKGPDLTDQDLGRLLDGLDGPRAVVVAGTSSAGALVPALRGVNRVVVAATRERERQTSPVSPFLRRSPGIAGRGPRQEQSRVAVGGLSVQPPKGERLV